MYKEETISGFNALYDGLINWLQKIGFNQVGNDTVTLGYSKSAGVGSYGVNNISLLQQALSTSGSEFGRATSSTNITRTTFHSNGNYFQIFKHIRENTTYGIPNQKNVNVGYIEVWLSTGFDGKSPCDQPGLTKATAFGPLPLDWNGKAWFFGGDVTTGGHYASLTLEEKAGVYMTLGLGMLEKYLDFVGGSYATGHVRFLQRIRTSYDFNAFVCKGYYYSTDVAGAICAGLELDYPTKPDAAALDHWWGLSSQTSQRSDSSPKQCIPSSVIGNGSFTDGMVNPLILLRPNSFSGRSVPFPLWVFASNPRERTYFSCIGHFPGIRIINLQNILAEDEIRHGTDVWKCFPVYSKTGTGQDIVGYDTGNAGYAFLK